MRKVSKILFIIFIIMTVFSSGVSIILGVSSSTFLTFTNNATSRNKTLYTSYYKLITSDKITIKMTQPYGTEGDTSEDTMVCYLDKELAAPDYNCQMISYLYDSNNEVKRTSYFPGDNYKYTIEGTTKTKSSFPNKSLTSHFKNMVIATYTVLFTLSKDEKDVKAGSVIYDFNISFNFIISPKVLKCCNL